MRSGWFNSPLPTVLIGLAIGRSPSTISRELRQNRHPFGQYRPFHAYATAATRQRRLGAFDPGDDGDAQLVSCPPSAPVEHVPLQQRGEGFHGGGVPGRADLPIGVWLSEGCSLTCVRALGLPGASGRGRGRTGWPFRQCYLRRVLSARNVRGSNACPFGSRADQVCRRHDHASGPCNLADFPAAPICSR